MTLLIVFFIIGKSYTDKKESDWIEITADEANKVQEELEQ